MQAFPSTMGGHICIHPKPRQPLGPGLLDAQILALAARVSARTGLAPAGSGRTLRAEATGEDSGGGATLWWDPINHFKVKGSEIPSSPWRGEDVLLSVARRFPAAGRQQPWAGVTPGDNPSRRGLSWQVVVGTPRIRCPWAQTGTPPQQAEVHDFPFLSKRTGLSARGWRLRASRKPEL